MPPALCIIVELVLAFVGLARGIDAGVYLTILSLVDPEPLQSRCEVVSKRKGSLLLSLPALLPHPYPEPKPQAFDDFSQIRPAEFAQHVRSKQQ